MHSLASAASPIVPQNCSMCGDAVFGASGDPSQRPRKTSLTASSNAVLVDPEVQGSLRGVYLYFEKDPRRLTINGSFEVTTGNNETYFLTHGSDTVADDEQESYALSDNAGAGASLSIVGSKLFNFGDKLAFWVNTISPSPTTIDKMVIYNNNNLITSTSHHKSVI